VSKLALQQDNGKFFPTVPYVTNGQNGANDFERKTDKGFRKKDKERSQLHHSMQ